MVSYCGYIALVGRPNVGKSTLMNTLLQQKISITSKKPQTTRHSILGIETQGEYQMVYVDTPGIHQGSQKAMNRLMNRTALQVLNDVDLIAFVVEANRWVEADDYVLSQIKQAGVPCLLIINKIDRIADKSQLLPWLAAMNQRHSFEHIIPLSAKTGLQVEALQKTILTYLPEGPHLFPEDQCTDRSRQFLCAELLREKIVRFCGQELPYSIMVDIESFKEEEQLVRIHALILVEKPNHKRMLIGERGSKLKEMATNARLDMEKMLDKKVFLQCWCKVKSGWSDDERLLKQLGYGY